MKYIDSIRTALTRLITGNNAFILGEDVCDPYGGAFSVTKGLSTLYPNNVINMPMCEQGITATACGMALMGDYVTAEVMFGDFVTLICDQMINHAAKFHDLYKTDLHLTVRVPSGGYRGYGATHSQSIERLFFGVPGMQVVAANITADPGSLFEVSMHSGVPTIFVENKADYPRALLLSDSDLYERTIYEGDYPITRLTVKGGCPELTIITYGGMVSLAIEAARTLLYDEEIFAEIITLSNLTILSDIKRIISTNRVLIVEEGVSNFGWGTQIASQLAGAKGIAIDRLGAQNRSIPCSQEKEDSILVMPRDIVNAALAGAEHGYS